MSKNRLINPTIVIALLAILIASCSGSGNAVATAPKDQVTVQLSWFHGVEYAGFYAAVEKGYYAAENIEVTLNAGSPEINPLDEVLNGKAQFGIGSGDGLISAKAGGQDFVAVAAIFKDNPMAITSLKSDNIQRPEDLVGKTVGAYSMDLSDYFDLPFRAFITNTGLEKSEMNYALIEDFQGANEIKSGKMDAMSGMFATDQLVMTKDAGDEINLIYYKDYGVEMYINTIFVTKEFTQNNSDLVARFVRATMKGYAYAVQHTDEVASLALKYDDALDLSYQQKVMQAQIPFIDTGDGPIGSMDASVWQYTEQTLIDQGIISVPVNISDIFTNQFVETSK